MDSTKCCNATSPKPLRQTEIGEDANELAALGVALALNKGRNPIDIDTSVLAWPFLNQFVDGSVVFFDQLLSLVERPISIPVNLSVLRFHTRSIENGNCKLAGFA